MTQPNAADPHLDARAIAAYLDRALGDAERQRVEAHLVACAECRDEVAEVAGVLASPRRSWRWVPLAGLAAAAVLTLMLVRPGPEQPGGGAVVRGPTSVDVRRPAVELVGPLVRDATPAGGLTFVWRAVGADAHYRLVVTDERGDTVWTATTADTAQRAPAGGPMRQGRTYFWYVDALLPDGRSAVSAVRELRLSP